MKEVQEVKVGHHPIGITDVNGRNEVFVFCYSGAIYVFEDQ